MTSNQIAYANYREGKRHNLVQEALDTRQVVVNERNAETNFLNYRESVRHNKASEGIQLISAKAAASQAAAAHRQASNAARANQIQAINVALSGSIAKMRDRTDRYKARLNTGTSIYSSTVGLIGNALKIK